jgi:hypothetical protein
MLSYVRQLISETGNPPVVTPGIPIPYSRDEVRAILARLVMAQKDISENTHAGLKVAIIWHSAMGHQCGTELHAREVRINLDRPTGGTHDAMVPSSLSGSPETPILQDRRDSFHTLLLKVQGTTFIMNILILRLVTLVATRDYLLNGEKVSGTKALFSAVANSKISETRCLHALYDSEKTCVEAVKNCFKSGKVSLLFEEEKLDAFLASLKPNMRECWRLVFRHCNMNVLKGASKLVYRSPTMGAEAVTADLVDLTNDHGSFNFFGSGVDATILDSAVVDEDGNPRQGNNYMFKACSLVAKNGVVTPAFTQALVAERWQFCDNRIKHIKATISIAAGEPQPDGEFSVIAEANENLAKNTFGTTSYKARHDLEPKARSRKQMTARSSTN